MMSFSTKTTSYYYVTCIVTACIRGGFKVRRPCVGEQKLP